MPVLMTMDMPVGREDVEALSTAMGVRDNPPDGLIAHVFTEESGRVHIVDIWESEEHYARFRDDRLMPTMGKVMSERGISLPPGADPEPQFAEAFDLIRGK